MKKEDYIEYLRLVTTEEKIKYIEYKLVDEINNLRFVNDRIQLASEEPEEISEPLEPTPYPDYNIGKVVLSTFLFFVSIYLLFYFNNVTLKWYVLFFIIHALVILFLFIQKDLRIRDNIEKARFYEKNS